jgi:hypothetical protein
LCLQLDKKSDEENKRGTFFWLLLLLPSSKSAPGVVGGSVEDLELDWDIATGMTAGRVQHMACDGTTGCHDVYVVVVGMRDVGRVTMKGKGGTKQKSDVLFVLARKEGCGQGAESAGSSGGVDCCPERPIFEIRAHMAIAHWRHKMALFLPPPANSRR